MCNGRRSCVCRFLYLSRLCLSTCLLDRVLVVLRTTLPMPKFQKIKQWQHMLLLMTHRADRTNKQLLKHINAAILNLFKPFPQKTTNTVLVPKNGADNKKHTKQMVYSH